MRDIKFRMYVKATKKMFEVGKLDLQHNKVYAKNHSQSYFKTDDVELMQYTGIKDKNGKEVYEGDIVQQFDIKESGIIKYKYCQFGICCLEMFWNIHPAKMEIIGNIYDNPELMEEKR